MTVILATAAGTGRRAVTFSVATTSVKARFDGSVKVSDVLQSTSLVLGQLTIVPEQDKPP